MKQFIRTIFFRVLEVCGSLVGYILFLFPNRNYIYQKLISLNRTFSDATTLYVNSFFVSLGKTLYDLRTSYNAELTLPNGPVLSLDLSEKTQRQIFSYKLFEAGLSRFLLKTLSKGDTFFDVGSNVGYFALLAAPQVGSTGLVLALEPERKNFEILSRAVTSNKLPQIQPLQIAAADSDGGTMTLHVNPLNRGGNSMLPFSRYASGLHTESPEEIAQKFAKEELFQEVPVRTLDSLCEEYRVARIALMKIDVEGFEMNVLNGSKHIFETHIPERVVCEVNNLDTQNEVLSFFDSYGYLPFVIGFDGALAPLSRDNPIHGNVLFISPNASTNRYCPLCKRFVPSFIGSNARPGQPVVEKYQIVAMGPRSERDCPWCRASDKERLVYLYLEKKAKLLSGIKAAVLHIAPERSTAKVLHELPNITYISGDKFSGDARYEDGRYGTAEFIDVTDIPHKDATFDVVICNHVLEHVMDDTKAMREIFRVLKPGGYAVLQVPVTRQTNVSIEDPTITDREGRAAAFGQVDHVRIYAEAEYLSRLSTAGFSVEAVAPDSFLEAKDIVRMGINPDERIYVAFKAT